MDKTNEGKETLASINNSMKMIKIKVMSVASTEYTYVLYHGK
jgi:hypothetical protein